MCFGAVTGIRNNGICIAGSGGETKVAGWCGCATNPILESMYDQGYKIVSISHWCTSLLTRPVFEELTENGVVILVAGLDQHHQAYQDVPGVIHVGRAYQGGAFWAYLQSTSGPNMNFDVLVITEGLYRIARANTCEPAGGGTSIGTPLLAGVVALMRSVNPCLSPADIEEILVETAGPIPSNASVSITRAGVIDAYAAVLAAQNFVGEDQTWGAGGGGATIDNAYVSGNLDIFSGGNVVVQGNVYFGSESVVTIQPHAKLIVEGSLNLGENSTIIVKRGGHLIVDGGKLTRSWCADSWRGVIVEGNTTKVQQLPAPSLYADQCGIVELINGAVVEYAIKAVSMKPDHLAWPFYEYYGGLLIAEDATFQHNNRAVEFMQYRKFEDQSKFTDVTFDGDGKFITTHWENRGVTYDNCNFSNYIHQAILTWDAAINVVNGCVFDNSLHTQFDQASMHLFHTHPNPYASTIGNVDSDPNLFTGGYYHVFSTGAGNTEPTTVVNNIFIGGRAAAYIDGISFQSIQQNDFIGQSSFGNQIVDNGDYFNIASGNNYSDNGVGIYAWYDNPKYRFIENCFDYSLSKDFILFGGRISPDIGSGSAAAGNCFSTGNPKGIRLISVAIPDIFRYFVLNNIPSSSCKHPTGYPSILPSLNEPTLDCGSTSTAGPVTLPSIPCSIPSEPADIQEAISELILQIYQLNIDLNAQTYLSNQWLQFKYQITERERCLQLMKLRLNNRRGIAGELPDLVTFFQNDNFFYKTHVYGMMVHNGEYAMARSYLNALPYTTEAEEDFKFVQNINLDRMEDRDYILTPGDSAQLYSIGKKAFPYSGYARSLYYILTSEKLMLDLPGEEDIEPRSATSKKATKLKFIHYPNPFEEHFTLESSQPLSNDALISVVDIQGKVCIEQMMPQGSEASKVGIHSAIPGLYILVVTDALSGRQIFESKIIIH